MDNVERPVVHLERDGEILIALLDNPPVNALSHAVRAALWAAVERLEADASLRALLLLGAEGHFSAGADIREFAQPRQPPALRDLCNLLESCGKPVIAAMAGNTLGGGLEIALAAHYRLAVDGCRLGLPEVRLGLLPGAGGTQRAPRLMGAQAALALILSGRPLSATQAVAQGLADRLGTEARRDGLALARELLASGSGPRPTRHQTAALKNVAAWHAALVAARGSLSSAYRGQFSPGLIVECVAAACESSFDEGLRMEAAQFMRCQHSPEHAALLYAFNAERSTAKLARAAPMPPVACRQVAVVGGGTMGSGIAIVLLDAGLEVVLCEQDEPRLAAARQRIEEHYHRQVSKQRFTAAAVNARLARYAGTTRYADLASADWVVEAVWEDLAAKQAVFRELDHHCKPTAMLASNTSYLDIREIARVTGRPRQVIGLHFFSPAPVMRLLEVVIPPETPCDVVSAAFGLARRLGKIPVRTGICDGFIGNRILSVCRRAAEAMLEEGASPYQIDAALRHFGFAMGPFQTSDLAGGDIGWATRQRRAGSRSPQERYVQVADRLCERGWFGQKSGRGWYRYDTGEPRGTADPEVLEIVAAERRRAGVRPRAFGDDEIVQRYLAAMINEGARILEEGIAGRPLDIDVVLLNGYGFPRYRGGPMYRADGIGLRQVLADIADYARDEPAFWQPSALLLRLVAAGETFASLNHR
ncbi:3-hydroxyacyl-CoA dehydrogenase [Erwinia sp. E602]|uniref:3-hydroxyacyl-CoA dehydrogenase NAD-binding domain-containing protein n=1 Tax=Erwinia sp. E602 TaxID=2675378 RepID=UPI001BAB95D8|nr:3-hydroxyacyl-CoA dehydrogenase NAD-binding domain-containing protein [Erwinia sp. E602]QUG76409.1 3-hydroxyacyl-CoA dehydrogenase [Erwinia sp. E602]